MNQTRRQAAKVNVFLKLEDIVDKVVSRTMTLPSVQRGFVWKPYQIENLWDSLLRGYPTGSFVVSQHASSTEEYALLDGQQRASAICLGFYDAEDPKYSEDFFKTSFENIIVFIDRERPQGETDPRKYIFRVITKSHPWGYRKSDNEKPLESERIAEAMKAYDIKKLNYLKVDLKKFWPYDATDPIPFGMFIHAAIKARKAGEKSAVADLEQEIQKWKDDHGSHKITKEKSGEEPYLYSIKEIFDAVKDLLDHPVIPMQSYELPSYEAAEGAGQHKESTLEDEENDEVENLFVRLNSGGTPLRGEELNYSILKARIEGDLLSQLEKACRGFIHPARLVTIAFRLFGLTLKNAGGTGSISMKIKPKQFQRNIAENQKLFSAFLREKIIQNGLVVDVRKILVYSKSNKNGLPFFVANTLAEQAPEVMFLLMYRLLFRNDRIESGSRDRVLGMITLLIWLGKGGRRKDHKKLLENIWPCAVRFSEDRFWSSETMQRAVLDDGVKIQIPTFKKLNAILQDKTDIRRWTYKNVCASHPELEKFMEEMFYNNALVLYAQRGALSKWYAGSENEVLDDTNRVFDWDHISPQSKIEHKQNISEALKDWYPSNGNFRAWPYSLNRNDQDDATKDKLDPRSDEKKRGLRKFLGIGKETPLSKALLGLSFCEEQWLRLTSDDMVSIRENDTAKKIIRTIMQRNVDLCREWYVCLHIDELIPVTEDIHDSILAVINTSVWEKDGDAEKEGRTGYYLPLGDKGHSVYLAFSRGDEVLSEHEIEFGISGGAVRELKPPKKSEGKYLKYTENGGGIYGEFTLTSTSKLSVEELFRDLYAWLKGFSDASIVEDARKRFRLSLSNGRKAFIEAE